MGSTKAAQSPAASPAKGMPAPKKPAAKGVVKKPAKKPAPKKGGNRGKGRGQKKIYSDPRTQAAYERQRVLKELYTQVSLAIKPALEELADQNIKELTEDMNAHKEVEAYLTIKQQLDDQLDQTIQSADLELKTRIGIAERTLELDSDCTQMSYMNSFNYRTEEFYDGALNRTSILSELRREGRATDTPDLTYSYKEHIPYVSFVNPSGEPDASAEEQTRQTKPASKRKAEGQPGGQAGSKKPRHTGGLLASEQRPDGVPESNAPSPTPLYEQVVGPVFSTDLPDLPNGASEPDAYGVRTLLRRAKSPYNRLIIPPAFQFESDEIGFRDSTNDSTRKATRATRGMFLDAPNSNTWHLDNMCKDYDCREYKEDCLDPNLVKKHGLHPKYGIVLPHSRNESEPPAERVDGTRPVVFVPDKATTVHASRSVRAKKMDLMLEEDRTKSAMAMMLGSFCDKEGINPDEIITDEMRERERQAHERLAVPSDDDEVPAEEPHSQLAEVDEADFKANALLILQAADQLELEAQTLAASISRPSRPYDAVRDVFTSAEPTSTHQGSLHGEPDAHALSILADAALSMLEQMPQQLSQREAAAMNDSSMIDPRLLGPSNLPPPPPNAFLQTALNPTSTFTHIAPAPTAPVEVVSHNHPPRIPFANHSSSKENPVLPPLRPNRPDSLGKGPNAPQSQQQLPQPTHRSQEFGSPRGLIHTNSGTFYPPAPSRPYHQGLSFHEPPLMPMPAQQGQSLLGPAVMQTQAPLPPHIPPPYHLVVSPPPLQGQAHIAPMPTQMEIPVPSVSPPDQPLLAPSPPGHTPRHRASIPSNGNGAGKYRKIAAAPIPHNRHWPSNGGTELRLAHYDHKEAIKDYRANEPPPRSGPTTIRGWNVNNVSKGRNRSVKKEDSEEKDSPK
ncbi:hypothetical protein F4677DRAFT_104623 [Hypoxylon crocopeplum]|nr:hypothetical protein F4677DRAFT_104623 [Hypoxylon crocopeplum]